MEKNKVHELDSTAAFDFLRDKPQAVLIDVRAGMEFLFVGHPVGAIHVPWIDEPDWNINPNFVRQVRQVMLGGVSHSGQASAPAVLICRSGKRSLEAGEALVKAGLSEVYNIKDGFEGDLDDSHHRSTVGGWRFNNLPWEQC